MLDATTEVALGSGQATDFFGQDVHQGRLRVWATVGQDSVEVIPYAFVWIQLGGICRESHEMKAARARKKFLHGIASMDLAVVQQNDEMAGNLAQQMTKEEGDFFALDIVLIELTVEGAVKPFWTHRNAGDGRDTVMAIMIRQERSLAHRTPRATHGGNQQEAGFINKDYMGRPERGVFFTAGHTSRFHASMASSSRSIARASGFCGLQCNWWRSLPT